MTVFWAEHLWAGGAAASDGSVSDGSATDDSAQGRVLHGVAIEVADDRIVAVDVVGDDLPIGAVILRGLTIPGLVDAHSHAFHRALRGRTQADRGSFWTWRELMYGVASRLTPDSYERLATGVFAEMVLAGITTVGEFHYVHHRVDGSPYDGPEMEAALVRAAAAAGIRMTLLDTCYLAGGFAPAGDGGSDQAGAGAGAGTTSVPDARGDLQRHVPLSPRQVRFGDGTATAWAARATVVHDALASPTVLVGAAVHSVRAVPEAELAVVAAWADEHQAPLHVHVSEQPAENADSLRLTGSTPIALLAEHGVLGPRTTAVHATHLTDDDIAAIAASGTSVCFCVTTERDLADGIGPAAALVDAGVALNLGSDSHAVVDLFEEARGVELDERLVSNVRGRFDAATLLTAATAGGAASLGWGEAGRVQPGALADFVTVGLGSIRLAGWSAETLVESVVFAATAADVTTVVVGGAVVVDDGRHTRLADVPGLLHESIEAVTRANAPSREEATA